MRKTGRRIQKDVSIIRSEDFLILCRNGRCNVFVRNRKMPPEDLVLSMINRKGISTKLEVRNFMNISHPGVQISTPGYLKQRLKLNPDALEYLYEYHNKNFYEDADDGELYTFHGYLVLAADGTSINVPTNEETLSEFGNASRPGTKPCAQLGMGCLYDVLNRQILKTTIKQHKFNEMAVAEEQIASVKDTIGNRPFLVTMDRGYPSLLSFIRYIENGTCFCVRLSSKDYKSEQQAMSSDDEDVAIVLTKNRKNRYLRTGDYDLIKDRKDVRLRFVRVWLDESHTQCEIFATNLPRDQFPADCFGELYHLRWNVETAFETLKDRLQIENFTGTKPILIKQDIFSTIYVCNLVEDIARESELEQKEHLENDYKHRMAINRSVCIGLLKSDLIYILLQVDPQVQEALFQKLYEEISASIVPIRPNRKYERTKGNLTGKYSTTHKRNF